jgi:hypothetical protein
MTAPEVPPAVQEARRFAEQSAALAAKLKPGTFEAASALALISIAHSLTVLAESAARR